MGVPIDAVVIDWQHWSPGEWGSLPLRPGTLSRSGRQWSRDLHAMHVHLPVSVWPRFDLGTANAQALEEAGGLLAPHVQERLSDRRRPLVRRLEPRARALLGPDPRQNYGGQGFDAWWLDASEPELGGEWGELAHLQTAAGPGAEVFNSYPLLHTTASS